MIGAMATPASTGGGLRTERLLLRRWREEDRQPFADLNADPEVMRHFPAPLTRAESDWLADLADRELGDRGYGLWAVEVPGADPFIGFVGLSRARFQAHFAPAVEVGWRLARRAWGRGYAAEAAQAALAAGFEQAGLVEIVSFTVPGNARSRAVMDRLGMGRDPADDFDHPALPEGHPLRRHVLYRLRREDWLAARDRTPRR
jgi:RimJ/RimL family protein N-acetyltransferase